MRNVSTLAAVTLGLSLVAATPALAQNNANQGAASPDVSQQQLQTFADAQSNVREVRQDFQQKVQNGGDQEAMADARQKANEQMVQAVQNSGMSVEDYNRIAQAARQNPDLAQRIEQAR